MRVSEDDFLEDDSRGVLVISCSMAVTIPRKAVRQEDKKAA
jgi:hypothetical protein